MKWHLILHGFGENVYFVAFLSFKGNKKLLEVNNMWDKLLKHYDEKGCVVNEEEWP